MFSTVHFDVSHLKSALHGILTSMQVSHFLGAHTRALTLLDISSASVGVGVAVESEEGVNLVWSARLPFVYQQEIEYERFVKSMLTTLLEVGMLLTSQGFKSLSGKHGVSMEDIVPVCVLGAPWCMGLAESVQDELPKREPVTKARMQALETEVVDKFGADPQVTQWKLVMGDDVALFDKELMRVLLEGYPVEGYQGRRAQQVKAYYYGSFASAGLMDKVRTTLEKVLPNHSPVFAASSHVFYRSLDLQGLTQGRLLAIELAGEMTSVSSIARGSIQGMRMFPAGTNHILRAAFPDARTREEAMGGLSVLGAKRTKDTTFKMPMRLQKALDTWMQGLQDVVVDLTSGVASPRNVVLLADNEWRMWYMPVLESPWIQPGTREEGRFYVVPHIANAATGSSHDQRLASLLRGILTVVG